MFPFTTVEFIVFQRFASIIEKPLAQLLLMIFASEDNNYVKDVKAKLNRWLSVLEKLDARKSKEATIHSLERDIRDLVCRIEDVVGTFSILTASRGDSIRERMYRTIHVFSSFQEFKLEVKQLNDQLTSTVKVLENLNMLPMIIGNIEEEEGGEGEGGGEERTANENSQWLRQPDIHKSEEYIVGMEEHMWTLNSLVVDPSNRVICIYGSSGIGKTTLARKLYNDPDVRIRFQNLAWVDIIIAGNIPVRDFLGDVLKQLSGPNIQITNMLDDVDMQLQNVLRNKECLIVLDGMRSVEDWENLCGSFLFEGTKSKLLSTTQVEQVADCMARDGKKYSVQCLNAHDSWGLFQKNAFWGDPKDMHLWKIMIAKEILEECRGIPSAIIATGKLLATKHTELEWKSVLEKAKSCLWVEQVGNVQPSLALNYDDLPFYLKPCFLYLGLFPKGSKIEVECLYPLWLAEGMLSPNDNETVLDAAERYLTELVQRQMVEVIEEVEGPQMRKYKYCWVAEPMQHLCLQKGKEYSFKVLSLGPTSHREADSSFFSLSTSPVRRLAVYLSKSDLNTDNKIDKKTAKHLRSLLLLNPHDLQAKLEWFRGISDLIKFRMLRALTVGQFDFRESRLPRGVTQLIHLKYLSFRGSILKKLPSSIGNLAFLLILDLRVESSTRIMIPNVLCKMKRLKHLYFPYIYQTRKKLYLGTLKQVEMLENFDTRMCNIDDLLQMEKLGHLSVTIEGNLKDLEDTVQCMNRIAVEAGRSLSCLVINVKNIDCYTEERHLAFRKLLGCKILNSLYMDGHLERIPWPNEITSSLTKIILLSSRLKEDPMATFDKLPKLEVLVLQDDAFVGKMMKCSSSGFGELKCLRLLTLFSVEGWEVENGAMPKLSVLAVQKCSLLKEMPPEALRRRSPPVLFEDDTSSNRI